MKQKIKELDKQISKATWCSCMAKIVGDEELVQKYETIRDQLNAEWLRLYDASRGETA